MASKRRKKRAGGGPLSTAGLVAFYEDTTLESIKISPKIVVGFAVAVAAIVVIMHAALPAP